MKKSLTLMAAIASVSTAMAAIHTVKSPDERVQVDINDDGGQLSYSVNYDGKTMLLPSKLGAVTNIGDFTKNLKLIEARTNAVDTTYYMRGTKASKARYKANLLDLEIENGDGKRFIVTFSVGDNDIAYRYTFLPKGDTRTMVITDEISSFNVPNSATAFITPQCNPMTGWMRTKPSYEEVFSADAPVTNKSQYGRGYTFPALFHIGDDGWMLISETGTSGKYAGCRLSDYILGEGYEIEFPMEGEANGWGSNTVAIALPDSTPWRTITVGSSLKPIAETTITYDVVTPSYEASQFYNPGRYTWSWLVWQDNSINYEDQVAFIDVASEMGYEYCLVDAAWDVNIGRDKMALLSEYAKSKGVHLLLWYNSNGYENDAPQPPHGCMDTSAARRREMKWLQEIGVKGIKVDFFGGDKQHTMQLYEDILSDANDYGLQVIFHGCTIPRGWERMFPNYAASEAVLASENVYFDKGAADREAYDLTIHPFCRNAVGAMDWGGTIMNKMMSRDNKSRHPRATTNVFEMAAAIVIQSSVQCIAMQPNNLEELSADELAFLRKVPTQWDETQLIDGYPGKYVVIARRNGNNWYVAGLNAEKEPLTLTLDLPQFANEEVEYYTDYPAKDGSMTTSLKKVRVSKDGKIKVTMQPNGGIIISK